MRMWIKLGAVAVACVALGIVVALVLLVELLHAPPSDTVEALQYLITSAVVSLVVGAVALLALSRFLPTLALKIGVACSFGSIAAIINVLYTPWLMFKSHHDLDLLLITLIYFLSVSLALAFIIATATTRQLKALHQGAMKVASGDFGTSGEVEGTDEVA